MSKLPTIPKTYANQQVIYRVSNGEKDRYGKQKTIDTIINNCVFQKETIYTGTGNSREVVANAVLFIYADVSTPLLKFDKNSQGNKIVFDGVEYTIKRIVENRNPMSNDVWNYELEVL
ncbi:putative minor capsid protein [Leuconostoc citreum]|uniref:putative minor capsid protein n=1 Tax=Leuconostoc citreum TaxID=33964 RepID=UPI001058EE3F|nr:putative minor capsid protein [Leuconostoc citreum]MBU7450021.1 capsid protein [Leuconostoc citreum]MCT3068354.1 capsid protein [Leuconostoc citreum]GDZ85375.1 hypothetical protein LCTS_05740 [Leuconostoc citreum]